MNLREWLDSECVEIKQLAGKLGVNRKTLYNWMTRGVVPLRIHRALIQRVTKGQVKIGDWEDGEQIAAKRLRGRRKNEVRSQKRLVTDEAVKLKVDKKGR